MKVLRTTLGLAGLFCLLIATAAAAQADEFFGRVYENKDQSPLFKPGTDAPLENVQVFLVDKNKELGQPGFILDSVFTNAAGEYSFPDQPLNENVEIRLLTLNTVRIPGDPLPPESYPLVVKTVYQTMNYDPARDPTNTPPPANPQPAVPVSQSGMDTLGMPRDEGKPSSGPMSTTQPITERHKSNFPASRSSPEDDTTVPQDEDFVFGVLYRDVGAQDGGYQQTI